MLLAPAKRALGAMALIGFLASLLVHVETVTGRDLMSISPLVWVLHAGAILSIFASVLSARGALMRISGGRPEPGAILQHVPKWTLAAAGIVSVYVLINTFLCLPNSGDGNASLFAGEYFLRIHGRAIAKLTEAQYHLHRAWELRLYSGAWLVAYAISALYFFGWRD